MAHGLLARRALALGTSSLLVLGAAPLLAGAALAAGPPAAVVAAEADTTPPALVFSSPSDGGSTQSGPVALLYGEALAPTSALSVFDSSDDPVAGTRTFTDGDRRIVFTPDEALLEGAYTATATVRDLAGNVTTTALSFTVDQTAPAAPTVSVPPFVRNTVAASGEGEPGASVGLVITDGDGQVSGAATVTPDGSWSASVVVSGLSQGTLTVVAEQTDAAGNTSPSASDTTVRDTVAPSAPTITSVTPDPINNAGVDDVQVEGTATGAATATLVVVDKNGLKSDPTTVTVSSGAFSFTGVDVSGLADGALTFSVRAADAAGNLSTADTESATKDTSGPQVTGLSLDPAKISSATQDDITVTGGKGAGDAVTIVVSDGVTQITKQIAAGPATTFTTGAFSVKTLADGVLTATATPKSGSGNTGPSVTDTAVKDATAPAQPTISAAAVNTASAPAYPVSGVTEAGAKVRVVVDDDSDATDPAEQFLTAGPQGAYAASLDVTGLEDGPLSVVVAATDGFGNVSSRTVNRTKDTSAPGTPTVALSPAVVGGNGSSAPVATVSGVLDGADSSRSGMKVVVSITDGAATTAPVEVIPSGGAYSVDVDTSALADGVITATAVVREPSGNVSPAATKAGRKDTVDLKRTGTTPAPGGKVRSGGLVSATYSEPLAGTSTSRCATRAARSSPARSASRTGATTIVFDPTQAFSATGSPYTAELVAKDRSTQTASSSFTFSVGAASPPSVQAPETVDRGNQAAFVVSGTAEAGAALAVTVADQAGKKVTSSATSGSDGSWATPAFSVAELADGTLTTTAVATYTDGVVSSPATDTSVKDLDRADLVALTAPDGKLMVRTTPGAFTSLGGVLKSAPSIVTSGGETYYVGVGSDDNAYVRTASLSWKRLTPAGSGCQAASAVANGSTLAVACRGISSGRLLVGKATLTKGSLPVISKLTDLGGAILAGTGPSVALSGTSFRYVVTWTDRTVYSRTDTAAFRKQAGTPATCYGTPTVNTVGTVLACVNSKKALQVKRNDTERLRDDLQRRARPGRGLGRPRQGHPLLRARHQRRRVRRQPERRRDADRLRARHGQRPHDRRARLGEPHPVVLCRRPAARLGPPGAAPGGPRRSDRQADQAQRLHDVRVELGQRVRGEPPRRRQLRAARAQPLRGGLVDLHALHEGDPPVVRPLGRQHRLGQVDEQADLLAQLAREPLPDRLAALEVAARQRPARRVRLVDHEQPAVGRVTTASTPTR